MHTLLVAWRDLCLLRIGPQDMPYAPSLLALLIIANVAVSLLVGVAMGSVGTALLASLVSIGVGLGVLYGLLSMRHIHARFVQAATAIMAAALLFSVLSLPMQLALSPMPSVPEAFTQMQMASLLVAAVLGLWSLAVAAHIYRHALNWSFPGGLLVAVFVNIGALVVLRVLIPAAA
ncbi:MAG: hypothetical protein L0H70_05360 [Xanthomonadales bacterium]|nr:hypothetical protein [Xanthomonadales bacterium]